MREIIFITGGQRSGKSNFAKRLAEGKSASPIFLATSRIWDEEFADRIKRHQSERGSNWQTIEKDKSISQLKLDGKVVVLDCITLWLNNFFFDNEYDLEKTLQEVKNEWNLFIDQDFTLIVISNEIGMGVIPADLGTRQFTDLQGWVNQHIASLSDSVYLMVSGISVKIK
ncbi:MAG: bifunctional adenosylcobinamide kinase/adenosylcobinamide-phosphate guanylyltransferase [Bacteroidales bacterium]|nr:bifunctional adenosylcobinamide kinase/adenosylcobinamide-phosphate guanylyltransferase [Bacteroidales bacterium]